MKTDSFSGKLPWEGRPPIFEHVKAHLKDKNEKDRYLPDVSENNLHWKDYTPGYNDYSLIDREDPKINSKFIDRLIYLFDNYSKHARLEDKVEFYNMVKDHHIIGYMDEFFEKLSDRKIRIEYNAIELIYWMVRKAPDREVVKLGILFVGMLRNKKDLNLMTTLSQHEEFTFYVGIALFNMTPEWEVTLIKLIEPLSGHGKLLCLRYLLSNSEQEDTIEWCIRYGYQRLEMTELGVMDCMQYCNVPDYLQKEKWDEPLTRGVQVMLLFSLQYIEYEPVFDRIGKILYLYLRQTRGKRRGIIQYFILLWADNFFKSFKENEEVVEIADITEEEFADMWIEVLQEKKKSWYAEFHMCWDLDRDKLCKHANKAFSELLMKRYDQW